MSNTQGTGNNLPGNGGPAAQQQGDLLFSPLLLALLPAVLPATRTPRVLAVNIPAAAGRKLLDNPEVTLDCAKVAMGNRAAEGQAAYDLVVYRAVPQAPPLAVIDSLTPALKPEAGLLLVLPDSPSPSSWYHHLCALGFQAHMGFAPTSGCLNLLAVRGGTGAAVDELLRQRDCRLRVPPSAGLQAAQKSPGKWSKAGIACGKECGFYLCLDARCCRRFTLELRFFPNSSLSPFSLDIVLNNRLVNRLVIEPKQQQKVECRDLLLLPGGNQLSLRPNMDIPLLPLTSVAIESVTEAANEAASLNVPPDVYSRYMTIRSMVKSLHPARKRPMTVLDVGGGGGWVHLFLADICDTYSLDKAAWDHPRHIQADFFNWSLQENAFDIIVTADTLEHLPKSKRESFLERLGRGARCALIVIAPVQSQVNEAAEELLAKVLHKEFSLTDAFLTEHQRFGLPDRQWLARYFAGHFAGYHELQLVPVDRWLITILLDYYMTYEQYTVYEYSACNRFYNSAIAEKDIGAAQGYRLAVAGTKQGFALCPPVPASDPCSQSALSKWLGAFLAALKEKNHTKRAYDALYLRYQYYLKAIEEHKDIIAELRQRLQEYQQENQVLRTDLEETRKENAYLRQELDRHKQVVAQVNKDNDLLEQERKKLLTDNGRYQQETAKLTEMLSSYQAENDKLLVSLQAAQQDFEQKSAATTSHISKLTAENKALYAEIDKRSAEIQARQKDITGLLGTIQHQKDRMSALQVARDDNEKILAIKEQKISQLTQARQELQAEYQKLAKIKATIQASMNDLEKENSLYRLELEAIHESFSYRLTQNIRKLLGRS